ncbi:hypothetical protein T07_4661 [Trichinella nelsoni]|uniref:Uncharacterized protein n=1 Tax=Trichinella nelsoni TaxID=6336 RepID=A0A0V0RX93_9BILA|nr:hypothetical protein T07_4661 [Trichinella nelsoni]
MHYSNQWSTTTTTTTTTTAPTTTLLFYQIQSYRRLCLKSSVNVTHLIPIIFITILDIDNIID